MPKADDDNSGLSVTVNNVDAPGTPIIVPVDSSSSVGAAFGTRVVPLAEREIWFKTYWRPAAAWIYLMINLFDFIAAPVISMFLPKLIGGTYVPWLPLTLSNGGMFHLAFGAIIGVTAWGRTREKVSGLGGDAG